jgi:hypothetical protein
LRRWHHHPQGTQKTRRKWKWPTPIGCPLSGIIPQAILTCGVIKQQSHLNHVAVAGQQEKEAAALQDGIVIARVIKAVSICYFYYTGISTISYSLITVTMVYFD